MRTKTAKIFFFSLATVLIVLNGLTLISALPYTNQAQPLCFTSNNSNNCISVARDFSAYYEGAYRFIHNPGQVYHEGNLPGDYPIPPNPQYFRYSPFFLPLFIVPLVTFLNYQNALISFDIIQYALLPLVAYLLFKILIEISGKGSIGIPKTSLGLFSLTLLFATLQPLVPHISNLTFWSWSYFRLWLEGEARVLQTLLLILTFYLLLKNSKFSGLSFVLSSFDPRMSIFSLPLIFYICLKMKRNGSLRKFALSTIISFCVIYLPTLLYANLGEQFLKTIFIGDFTFYSYEWIPLTTIAAITCSIVYLDYNGRRNIASRALFRSGDTHSDVLK